MGAFTVTRLVLGGDMPTNKSLGQHWLRDRLILEAIADSVPLTIDDTVLEIGPGLGTLTSVLLSRTKEVIAVEYDEELARKLPGQFPGKRLTVVQADFLTFDLSRLPDLYSVVANIPYYISTKIIQRLVRAEHLPRAMALLVQKEVAEKLAALPGRLTPLAIEAQLLYDVSLGYTVSKQHFTPPPNVDSQVVILAKRQLSDAARTETASVMKLVRAGFSAPRKKLKTALMGSLRWSKTDTEACLDTAKVNGDCRAQDVTLDEWRRLADVAA